jgi:hypothetical protein
MFHSHSHASTGSGDYVMRDSAGTTIASGSFSGQNTTGGNMHNIRRACTSNAFAGSIPYWEYGLLQTSDFGDPGAFPTNLPPTADAGVDQTGLEPWSTATLSGALSHDIDGTIASYTWFQTLGTPVTLSNIHAVNPTFTVPADLTGGTLQFRLIVTDDGGANSDPAYVNIDYLPATEFYASGGLWRPIQVQAL